ncbi:MAG TPA: hypothetical protein VHX38_23210 [Pseudonocardiaceae bacterium]|jgi:hypothetical protein|nr:hypothetical protein [Pseudonocardiaceae bacterium]
MGEEDWVRMPVGLDAGRWLTRETTRTVLVAVHTVVAGQRLLDVLDLLESDPRIQVVFTAAPDVFDGAVPRLLAEIGAVRIPWQQAVRERFDLALAGAYGGLARLHAPVLVLPHGAGYGKRTPTAPGSQVVPSDVYGLGREQLIADGRLVPASIVLSHESQRDLLAAQCPAALPAAVVAGDPCYDRLRASLARREAYRTALGVGEDQQLVVAASTWGRDGLFGQSPELIAGLPQAVDPRRYRVAALFHPAVWAHGPRQLRAWLAEARAAGLLLIDPMIDWRGVIVAADHVIGDHGSITTYAASIGRGVLHLTAPGLDLAPGSAQAYVRAHAPRWDPDAPVADQLRRTARSDLAPAVRARLTSRPGRAHRIIRRAMYQLLELSEPATSPAAKAVQPPVIAGERHHG